MNTLILKARVMVRGTKIEILKREILFSTNPWSWGHYMGCFQRRKILVNFCCLNVDLSHEEVKNVLKNASFFKTWGLFLIMRLGAVYFGERQPKHICIDSLYRWSDCIGSISQIGKKVLSKIVKITFFGHFYLKWRKIVKKVVFWEINGLKVRIHLWVWYQLTSN